MPRAQGVEDHEQVNPLLQDRPSDRGNVAERGKPHCHYAQPHAQPYPLFGDVHDMAAKAHGRRDLRDIGREEHRVRNRRGRVQSLPADRDADRRERQRRSVIRTPS